MAYGPAPAPGPIYPWGGSRFGIGPAEDAAARKALTASYGKALPFVYGLSKIAGALVFIADKIPAQIYLPQNTDAAATDVSQQLVLKGDNWAAAMEIALCEGPIQSIQRIWRGNQLIPLGKLGSMPGDILHVPEFLDGSQTAAWSYLNKYSPEYRVALGRTAYVRCDAMGMPNGDVPSLSFEVLGFLGGSELTSNGSFASGLTGWTYTTGTSWSTDNDGGFASITAAGTLVQAITVPAPGVYSLGIDVPLLTGGDGVTGHTVALGIKVGTTSGGGDVYENDTSVGGGVATAGRFTAEVVFPAAGTFYVYFARAGTSSTGYIKLRNVSVLAAGVHPADVLVDLFTNRLPGVTAAQLEVDHGPDGLTASSFRTYCTAMGFSIAGAIDSQTSGADAIQNILDSCNSTAVESGGKLKIIPLGDQPVTGNGVTYTPTTVATAIGVADFADKANPITVTRRSAAECFNVMPVQFTSRVAAYSRVVVDAPDEAAAEAEGRKVGGTFSSKWISTALHAQALSSILAQRSSYVRNRYTVKVSWRFIFLEPGDLVSLTEPNLQLSGKLARIISAKEDAKGIITLDGEEWPHGVATPISFSPQTTDGTNGAPGISPIFPVFQAADAAAAAAAAQTSAASAVSTANAASAAVAGKANTDLANVIAGSVSNTLLATGAVDAGKLASGAVSAPKLTLGATYWDRLEVVGADFASTGGGFGHAKLNGTTVTTPGGRGHTLVAFNRSTHALTIAELYDTYSSASLQTALATRLNGLDSTTLVILFSGDAICTNAALDAALKRCGASSACEVPTQDRFPYALIGYPGLGEGNGIEARGAASGEYVQVACQWIDSEIQGASASLTPYTVVDTQNLRAGSVTANVLGANSVVAGKIQAGAVGTNELAANSVVAGKVAADAIGATQIAAGSIVAGKIGAGVVGATELAAGAVTTLKLAALAVTADKIAANCIDATKITTAGLNASIITAGTIDAARVNAASLSIAGTTIGAIGKILVTGQIIVPANTGGTYTVNNARGMSSAYRQWDGEKYIIRVDLSRSIRQDSYLPFVQVANSNDTRYITGTPITGGIAQSAGGVTYMVSIDIGLAVASGAWSDPGALGSIMVFHFMMIDCYNYT